MRIFTILLLDIAIKLENPYMYLKRKMETIKNPNGYSRIEKHIYEMKNHWMGLTAD